MMNVLGLCSYPIESAATRYRLAQFVEPLKEKGINLEISSFLDSEGFNSFYSDSSLLKKIVKLGALTTYRGRQILNTRDYDLLFVQREAMFYGPAFFEWIYQKVGKLPMILDLDDATYIPYVSPTFGQMGSLLKFFGKTNKLIERAEIVTCGNRYIADYVEQLGSKAAIVPTVVDSKIFHPLTKTNDPPVIGWIGTHSTFPFLESIFPVLEDLAKNHEFVLKIVGSGRENVISQYLTIENLPWKMAREVADFQSFDIGLYPIQLADNAPEEWILGKSGFKAIQYLSVGIPFVMTPIGVCADIGVPNETHFAANNEQEWYDSLERLILDRSFQTKMGEVGRQYSLSNYSLVKQVEKLEQIFREIG